LLALIDIASQQGLNANTKETGAKAEEHRDRAVDVDVDILGHAFHYYIAECAQQAQEHMAKAKAKETAFCSAAGLDFLPPHTTLLMTHLARNTEHTGGTNKAKTRRLHR
jgi:trans-aconitate methyltransferase